MPQSQTLLPAEHTYDAPSAATAAAASATAFPVVPEAAPVAVLPGRLRAWAAAAVRAEADILARASSSQDPSQDPGRSNAQRAKHVRAGRQVHALSLGDVAAVEVPWLVGHLAALASPLVFSHNDINAGNVMEQMAADTSAVGNIMLVGACSMILVLSAFPRCVALYFLRENVLTRRRGLLLCAALLPSADS